jgi:hypothetical protein
VKSRWCLGHRIDRHHQGTCRWVPGNQSSRIAFMTICRTHLSINPFFTLSIFPNLRLDTLSLIHPWHVYTSRVSWGVPRLKTLSSGVGDPRWLLPQTSLYEWAHECVVGVNRCLRGVRGFDSGLKNKNTSERIQKEFFTTGHTVSLITVSLSEKQCGKEFFLNS